MAIRLHSSTLVPEVETFDVMPNGSRFFVVLPVQKDQESPLRVILNWQEELKQREVRTSGVE